MPLRHEDGGTPAAAQRGQPSARDVALRRGTLDAQLQPARAGERRVACALAGRIRHGHHHAARAERRDAPDRDAARPGCADREGGGERGDEHPLAVREQEPGKQTPGVRERAPRDEWHRAHIARARRRASSGVGGAARNAAPRQCYPAIGSGWRSRTIAPVNVEPVVPVSSTVR